MAVIVILLRLSGGRGVLEQFSTNLGRRDGADFGPAREARRRAMRDIVRDERRCDGPKSARRRVVAPDSPLDSVASLSGAPSPRRTPTRSEASRVGKEGVRS